MKDILELTDVEHTIEDDSGILHTVGRLPSGKLVGEMSLICRIAVDGKQYEARRMVRVNFKPIERRSAKDKV